MEAYIVSYEPLTIIALVIAGFLAAFIDSTVGGGGLISTPFLLGIGFPVPYALGTNKAASAMGAAMSVFSFWRAGKISNIAWKICAFSFLGSALGAYVVYLLPAKLMKNIIVVLLVAVAVYTYRRKDWGDNPRLKEITSKLYAEAVLLALVLGFYDGFFGPGTGSFLIFGFLFLGFDFVTAAGNAKVLNFMSGLGGMFSFAMSGTVVWTYGLIMGVAMLCGAFCGARLAIKKGAAYVRPLYLLVTTLLIGKQVYEIIMK
ncbi:MAG: TSUP family transporter [Phascolarctobacterium sp.]|nr:TSUP family transporter [Phascolarctobacterium sp.]